MLRSCFIHLQLNFGIAFFVDQQIRVVVVNAILLYAVNNKGIPLTQKYVKQIDIINPFI